MYVDIWHAEGENHMDMEYVLLAFRLVCEMTGLATADLDRYEMGYQYTDVVPISVEDGSVWVWETNELSMRSVSANGNTAPSTWLTRT